MSGGHALKPAIYHVSDDMRSNEGVEVLMLEEGKLMVQPLSLTNV